MFFITFPDNCREERSWISSILLDEFLGIGYEICFNGENKVRISAAGKSLELSDAFFAGVKDKWLLSESLPSEPLKYWAVLDSGLDPNLVESFIPVISGRAGFEIRNTGDATLNMDIFGSAFFMLSRYEEAVSDQRDNHGRFPAAASLAYRQGFLGRPIIDEYVEILWVAMKRVWPQLTRKPRRFNTIVTCDVDHPYHASATSFPRLIKRTAGEAIRKRTLSDTIKPAKNYFSGRNGRWQHDPYYYMVDWMMEENEKAGNRAAFYFIPEITDSAMDGTCSITEPAVRAMIKRIANRGHEIGIHPGYNTYKDKKKFISATNKLQLVLDEEGITQQVTGGRQHYLRWSTQTPEIWDEAGLQYDSTLTYADYAGFRCGTCHEYAMYDVQKRKALKIMQRPLICMECSVIVYMDYGFTESALVKMKQLKTAAQRFKGNFTMLWHNSFLETKMARDMYCEIIR